MNNIDIVQLLIPVAFAAVGWFLQSFMRLQTEFREHRSGYGHKTFVDYVNEEFKRIREDIAETDKRSTVNASKLDTVENNLLKVTGGIKYRFTTAGNRLDILEEVMRREGYTIFKSPEPAQRNDDTLSLEE